ncbi:type II secretion system F family protein [Natronoglycomyces albus]|uniref:Type II secretion system F family protein n=1 Tax=Natronoglycomyces albus TaxID=2811108 RepID=A0A895XPI7_9ACTN|nr:type II secretion system F family protein [Natronoglycomyces albus]QSB05453.1 type II secretion system F family protein [Natronoglycomyces albus]
MEIAAMLRSHPRLAPFSAGLASGLTFGLLSGFAAGLIAASYATAGMVAWLWHLREGRLRESRHRIAEEVSFLAADLQAGANPQRTLAATLSAWPNGENQAKEQLLSAWQVSAQLGAPTSGIAQALGAHLLDQVSLEERLHAQTSSMRATAGLLLVLPLFGVALGESMGAGTVEFLLHTLPGLGCVVAMLGLQLLGWMWTYKILASIKCLPEPRPKQSGSLSVRQVRGHMRPPMFHVEHSTSVAAEAISRRSKVAPLIISVCVGGVAVASISGWAGIAVASLAGFLCHRILSSKEGRAEKARLLALKPSWMWCLDLLASGLRSGAPFPRVAQAVASAMPPGLSGRLSRMAQMLLMGAPTREAVAELGDLPGRDRLCDQLERSDQSGAALANGMREMAAGLRRCEQNVAHARAGRASVMLVGPLCLCFLPAFVIAGVLPVIFGLLANTLVTL